MFYLWSRAVAGTLIVSLIILVEILDAAKIQKDSSLLKSSKDGEPKISESAGSVTMLDIDTYKAANEYEKSLLTKLESMKDNLSQRLRKMFTSLSFQVNRMGSMERDILDNVGEVQITSKAWFLFRVYRDRIRKARGAISNLSYKLNRPVSFIHNIDEEPAETTTDVEVALRQILEQLEQNIKLMGSFSTDRAKILRLMNKVSAGTEKSVVAEQKMNECLSLMSYVPEIEQSVKTALMEYQADQAAEESKNNNNNNNKNNTVFPEELLNKLLVAGMGTNIDAIDPMCLNISNKWQRCSFVYDGSYTDCHGSQYVKLSRYEVGRYVGVVSCGHHKNRRYKIFLGDSLSSKFLSVADLSGRGEDHCEFLGAEKSPYWRHSMSFRPGTFEGYLRRKRGETPVRRTLNGNTGHYSPKWYECGVAVP